MNNISRPRISKHRLARLIAWANLMLAWVGETLFSDVAARRRSRQGRWQAQQRLRRHIRRRYSFCSLDTLARLITRLVMLRASQLVVLKAKPAASRAHAPRGFTRRAKPRCIYRSVIGSKLRSVLRHRDPSTRLALLVSALTNIDTLASAFARRLQRGLSRLRAMLIARPSAADVLSLTTPAFTANADTS